MNVTINARHCEIPDTLREATERRVNRLGRLDPKLADAEVTYDIERVTHEVEIRLAVSGAPTVVARGAGDDFRAALGRGIDRASRQLRRARLRRIGAPQAPRA